MRSDVLIDLVNRIRRGEYGAVTSLLIARHEKLALEEYFDGWSADRTHTTQSVSKSVTSLLAGCDGLRFVLDWPMRESGWITVDKSNEKQYPF